MKQRGLTTRFVVAGAVLFGVIVAGFGVMAVAVTRLQDAGKTESHANQVLATANALEKTTIDVETGLRGYLLAGQTRFLQPYDEARLTYQGLETQLRDLSAGDSAQSARAVAISHAVDAYVNGWVAPLVSRARHDLAAARSAEASGGGKARLDAIRSQFRVFDAVQATISTNRASNANHLATMAMVFAFGGMAVCGLMVLLFSAALRRMVALPLRQLARGVGRVGAGELSVRVEGGGTAEVGELQAGFNSMAEGLELHRAELENQNAELEAQQVEVEVALQAVEEQKEHIQLLQRFGDALATVSGVETVSDVALREIGDVARAEIGAMYVLDERTGAYTLAARRGLAADDLVDTLVPGDGLAGRALAERRLVTVSYDEAKMALPGLVAGRDAAHELHAPLRHGERTLGVISLGRARDHAFTRDDFEVLDILTQRTAVVVAEAMSLRRLEVVAHELETLLESTDEGIYGVGTDGLVTFINRAALEQTGYSSEELLGRNAHELIHHTRPDGRRYAQTDCPILRSISSGVGVRVEDEVFWRKDGTPYPVEYSSYPLYDGDLITGAVITFVDISARKRLERQRDIQHAVTRVLADAPSVPEALPGLLAAICDGLGWNVGISWRPRGDGTTLTRFAIHAADGFEQEAELRASQDVPEGEGVAGLAFARREAIFSPDGGVAVPILGINGELLGVAEFVGEGVREEEGLRETLQSIAAQTAQYIERKRSEFEAERMRQEFVATVSHELRTPLTSIDGWLHVLLGEEPGALTDEQRKFLMTVKRNSDRLLRLVGDLLLAGQIESGKLSLELEDVDVVDVAREAVELVSAAAAAKELAIDTDIDGPAIVEGDRTRLMQLFNNLLSNAVKFTPEGGRVGLKLAVDDAACRVKVSDTGIGIPPADRARLFERFFRASSATDHGIAGTGLGLAISKAIAESHGGTIVLADSNGQGTTFVVELPLRVREELAR